MIALLYSAFLLLTLGTFGLLSALFIRRFKKFLPLLVVLCLIDLLIIVVCLKVIVSHSMQSSSNLTNSTTNTQNITSEFIPENFLLTGGFPKVYRKGIWRDLPQTNVWTVSEDQKFFAACGNGGVYVYDITHDKLTYIYHYVPPKNVYNWYYCNSIKITDDFIRYTADNTIDGNKTFIRSISDHRIISSNESALIQFPSPTPFIKSNVNTTCDKNTNTCATLQSDIYYSCDKVTTVCASLQRGAIKLSRNGVPLSSIHINNAVSLFALKDNYLFYTVRIPSKCCVSTSYSLYIYNINSKTKTQIPDTFNYQDIIFFD